MGKIALLIILFIMMVTPAIAQHPPEHQQLHDEFYNTWKRPKGPYNIGHRTISCCNKSDCFPVLETKMVNGQYFVKPDDPYNYLQNIEWYPVPASVVESAQPDIRESPDGRSHVCISGLGLVVCFVEGNGT